MQALHTVGQVIFDGSNIAIALKTPTKFIFMGQIFAGCALLWSFINYF